MVVNDWMVEMVAARFAHKHHGMGDNKPRAMLINGEMKSFVTYMCSHEGVRERGGGGGGGGVVHVKYRVVSETKRFMALLSGISNCDP